MNKEVIKITLIINQIKKKHLVESMLRLITVDFLITKYTVIKVLKAHLAMLWEVESVKHLEQNIEYIYMLDNKWNDSKFYYFHKNL
jgi:hypothetical protein